MSDLTEFLLARITEDEEAAQDGISSQADPENGWGLIETPGFAGFSLSPHVGHIHERVQGEHVIRWHPARVLAECEAHRQIVAEHSPVDPCDAHDASMRSIPCDTLRYLALPHADHPDYREEWRP